MRHFLKIFVGLLVGFAIYESINYALGGSFNPGSEVTKIVAIAAIAAALMTLFERWRGPNKSTAENRK